MQTSACVPMGLTPTQPQPSVWQAWNGPKYLQSLQLRTFRHICASTFFLSNWIRQLLPYYSINSYTRSDLVPSTVFPPALPPGAGPPPAPPGKIKKHVFLLYGMKPHLWDVGNGRVFQSERGMRWINYDLDEVPHLGDIPHTWLSPIL
jgi:hypothetical protein